MFDIGFWELSLILLMGLIVLGPERLPKAARTLGYYIRKIRTLAITAQQQLEREIDAEELRRYTERTGEQVRGSVKQLSDEIERGFEPASQSSSSTEQQAAQDKPAEDADERKSNAERS